MSLETGLTEDDATARRSVLDLRADWAAVRAAQWKSYLGNALTSGSRTVTDARLTADDVGKIALFLIDNLTDTWFMSMIVSVSGSSAELADDSPVTLSPVRIRYGFDGATAINTAMAEVNASGDTVTEVYLGGTGYRATSLEIPDHVHLRGLNWSASRANQLGGAPMKTVLAQLPGAERNFVTFAGTVMGDNQVLSYCGFSDFSVWGPEKNVCGLPAATTGHGVFFGKADGTPCLAIDGFTLSGVCVYNFPGSGIRSHGCVPHFADDIKLLFNGRYGWEHQRSGGQSTTMLNIHRLSGDWNNLGLFYAADLRPYDTVRLDVLKSEGHASGAEADTSLRCGPCYQSDGVILDSCDPTSSVHISGMSHIRVAAAGNYPGPAITVRGSVPRVTFDAVNCRVHGSETRGSATDSVTLRDEVNGVDIPRTVSSGFYDGTCHSEGFSVNGNAARPAWVSAPGGTGTEDGANTWCKIATFDPGNSEDTDLHLIFAVATGYSNIIAAESAIMSLKIRTLATGHAPTASLNWVAKENAESMFSTSAFKLVGGGFGTPLELWLTKTVALGQFSLTEVGRYVSAVGGWKVLYNQAAAWQSGAPEGSTVNVIPTNTPDLGTPSFGTLTNCTGLPPGAGLVKSASDAVGFGSIDLGHSSDTTVARSAPGVISVASFDIATKAVVSLNNSATLPAVGAREYFFLLGSSADPTMPTAVDNTSIYHLKATCGPVAIATTSGQTIDGCVGLTIDSGEVYTLISDNTNWVVF